MPYHSFETLEVWKRACRLVVSLYSALKDCKDFGLKDQMTRAATSIPSNIAEGYERGSDKDFVRFLRIAQGSSAELRTQIYIAQKIGVIDMETMKTLAEETRGISAMLQALAKSRQNTVNEQPDFQPEQSSANPIDDK